MNSRRQPTRFSTRAWAQRTAIAGMACASLLWGTSALAQPVPHAPTAPLAQPANPADIAALVRRENWPTRLAMLRRATEQQLEIAMSSPAWADMGEQRTALLADIQAYMAERFAWPGELQDLILKAYQEDASQNDVRALLDFYGSPDGQWLVRRFQNALDKVEQKLQLDARTLITHWIDGLSTAPAAAPYEPKPATIWRPESTHATQCAHALNTLVKPDWSRQLDGIKIAAIGRISRLINSLPDGEARRTAFLSRLKHEITYEAFEPTLVAALCAELSEPELVRGLAIEQSPARQALKPIESRLAQSFGPRILAWQEKTLMPGIGKRMQDARRAAVGQSPAR